MDHVRLCADGNVRQAIAVHVAEPADQAPQAFSGRLAKEGEELRPVRTREHVGRPCIVEVRVVARSAHEHVIVAVAVHVPRSRQAPTEGIVGAPAAQLERVGCRREHDRRHA